MNMALKLVKIGNSTGVVLPKDVLAQLGLSQGDSLSVSASGNAIELRPLQDGFEAQMKVAREVMQRRTRALRELAK